MMKKIVVLIVLLVLAGFSCNDCEVTKPKHKPVDWEGYNDVHTVYWNFTGKCSDFKNRERTGVTIKMYGWVYRPQGASYNDFYLRSDSLLVEVDTTASPMVRIKCLSNGNLTAIQAKFEASDLRKKCHVTGELGIMSNESMACCKTVPWIFIKEADDIVFE